MQLRHCSNVHARKRSRQITELMSSDPVSPDQESPEKVEISYPPVSDWLTGLDNHHIRGQDNQNYQKWINAFLDDSLLRLDDLFGLEADYYVRKFQEMNMGTAWRIERYAMDDIAKVKKRAWR